VKRRFPSSTLLRAKVILCSGPLDAVFTRLWAHARLNELAPSFLVLLHQIMRASVPLMQCGVQRCYELEPHDPLAKSLASYLSHHTEEEQNHDVWALEDLKNAGFDPQTAVNQVPSQSVAQLVGAQYYWILHHHPVMLLGYIMVLEAFPPTSSRTDAIRDGSGLPEAAFRTLRMHGELDPYHSAELDEFIDSLPLNQTHLDMIGVSILNTALCLVTSVDSLKPVSWP
jgi:hypothetical protein